MLGREAGMSGPLKKTASFENTLRQVSLFERLSGNELTRLSRLFVELEAQPGEFIVHGADKTTGFYVVRDGSVARVRQTVGRPVQLLARLRRGGYFGELGIFGDGRHMASVRASEPSRLLRITRRDLLAFFADHPEIESAFQLSAAQRHLANVTSLLEISKQHEVRIHLGQPTQLEIGESSVTTAVLENLSLGGLCLTGVPEDWQEGQVVSFGLGLRAGLLQLECRVAWRNGQTVGLVFEKHLPNHDTVIQMAIRVALELKERAGPSAPSAGDSPARALEPPES